MTHTHRLLLGLALSLFGIKAFAQVSNYVFTQSSGNYQAISGGTVFGNINSDDQVYVDPSVLLGNNSGATGPGLPIGFTFTFNGIAYDRLGINNNGWIFFGQSTLTPAVNSNISTAYACISGTSNAATIYQQKVGALSFDLAGQTGSSLRLETLGSSPNQTCVIQWQNYSKWNNTGDNYNFQIRLHETSNLVEVVYGSFTNNANALSAQVGLRGLSNTDYNNRSVNVATGWANSVPGVANTAIALGNNTGLLPANGQTYKWIIPTPCASAPAASGVTAQQLIVCPAAGNSLSLSTTYTNTNLSYQWFSSTVSAIGPFTPLVGATQTNVVVSNLTSNTWFQATITCSLTANTTTSSATTVFVAATTTNSIPYSEGFENLLTNNQLPNCSWSSSNPTVICQTYTIAAANNRIPHSGNKFAAFKFGTNPTGDYFFSNGLQLEAGVTYSASVWYITDGNLGWSNFSLLIGSSQSSTGLTNIASVTGAVTGLFYQPLSNTLTVASSGIYYLAIKCIGNSTPQYLSFDDISVSLPCSLNSPPVGISPGLPVLCSGSAITLSASGANSYTWSNGAQGPTLSVSPVNTMAYAVTGTSSLTGCAAGNSVSVVVNQSPNVILFAPSTTVCSGSSISLYSFGNYNFLWSTGQSSPSIVVSPTVNTVYSLVVTSSNGCSASASISIGVKSLPLVNAQSASSTSLCLGESVTLIGSGSGLVNYVWSSNNISINSQQAIVSPIVNTTYTLTASDNTGCSNTSSISLVVNACTGLTEKQHYTNDLKLYPNPGKDWFKLPTGNLNLKHIRVLDAAGRLILELESNDEEINLNMAEYANGIYQIVLTSATHSQAVKLIKN